MEHINRNISLFYVVEQFSTGLKLYSFHSFHWLSFCIMNSVLYILWRATVSYISLAKTRFEYRLSMALETHPCSIWPEKHAYFSLFHNIYQSTAAKTAVPTFLYNSTLDLFQWAGHSISSDFRPCSCLHLTQCWMLWQTFAASVL